MCIRDRAEALQHATSNNEKHRIHHNIGNILMKKDFCKEALEAYKNALRNNPNDNETRYNLSLAKLCADEQNKNDKKNDDKDDDKDDKDKDNKQDQKDDKNDNNKDDKNKDNKQDQEDNNKDKKKNDPSKERGSAKLSPEQIKNLLKAMNNEENKVQAKINEKKQKGAKIVTEKDW